jgi:hypothetical protein
MLLLLVSLGFSAWALVPHETALDIRCPDDVREAIRDGIAYKSL